jgi:hypothetical protein
MAAPGSIRTWREFVRYQATEPARLSDVQLAQLGIKEKNKYDNERFAWLGADVVLRTKDTDALTRQARISLARNAAYSATARRGLAITGPAGIGKSTAALTIGRWHEQSQRERLDLGEDDSFAPVVYVTVPPGSTPKALMASFTSWLGLPVRSRATAQELMELVIAVLTDLRTSLVIVDEVHNLHTRRQSGMEAASTLKVFAERLNATFIYAGVDLLQSDLLAGDLGRQLKARLIVHAMTPYHAATADMRQQWTSLVLGIESLLPLSRHEPGSLGQLSTYLWDRSGGSIGSLRAHLTDAAIEAILTKTEAIDKHLLDTIATDQASTELAHARTPTKKAIKAAG